MGGGKAVAEAVGGRGDGSINLERWREVAFATLALGRPGRGLLGVIQW